MWSPFFCEALLFLFCIFVCLHWYKQCLYLLDLNLSCYPCRLIVVVDPLRISCTTGMGVLTIWLHFVCHCIGWSVHFVWLLVAATVVILKPHFHIRDALEPCRTNCALACRQRAKHISIASLHGSICAHVLYLFGRGVLSTAYARKSILEEPLTRNFCRHDFSVAKYFRGGPDHP